MLRRQLDMKVLTSLDFHNFTGLAFYICWCSEEMTFKVTSLDEMIMEMGADKEKMRSKN